ncbi:BTB/POZ domain-containing protein [Canna indica]|uniref:BTB/POZ domain-containing protein n=1 Tax=Canna indica TaxID=4628 RepID=A0AAQ3JQ81_9LILI|nr:BTB/POZ domain-containing protein [Canna indica]
MKGWGELGVVDTIYEEEQENDDDEEEDEDDDDDDDDDESFNSFSLSSSAILTPSPPQYSSSLPPPPSLQSMVKEWSQEIGTKPDVLVRVHSKCFLLHREALVTRSGFFKRHLIENSAVSVSPPSKMTAETFAEIASFCYGAEVALTPGNLAALRVAAEWLEMGGGEAAGLVRRTEAYFAQEVAADAGRAVAVLRSCVRFLEGPDAEAAAAAEVAAGCAEALAAMDGGEGRWVEEMAALPVAEFGRVARSLRERLVGDHDLLYKMVDGYLRNHDGKLTEEEKNRICYNINCTKLSHYLLLHLVQNPRLPLRFVVQAMLVEQLHTRRCILDHAATASADVKPRHHRRSSSSKTRNESSCCSNSRSLSAAGDRQQLSLGAILQRDAARRRSTELRAAMEATSLRIQSLERDLAGLRQRLRWSEAKRAEMDSMRSASFRIVRPRGGEMGEGPAEAPGDGQPAVSGGGGGFGRRLVRGLKNMFRKSERVEEGNELSVGSTLGGGGGGGEEVVEVARPGHRRSCSFD